MAQGKPWDGMSVTEEELAEQCRAAQQSPSVEATFRRYRLNTWVSSKTQAVNITLWATNDAHPITEQDFEGGAEGVRRVGPGRQFRPERLRAAEAVPARSRRNRSACALLVATRRARVLAQRAPLSTVGARGTSRVDARRR